MADPDARHAERGAARESFIAEARASWAEYRQTGRHLTGEELRTWLAAWGAGSAPELPEYHT